MNSIVLSEDIAERFLSTSFDAVFVPEVFVSLLIMICLIILTFVINFKAKKALNDPLKPQKGILFYVTWFVEAIENFTVSIMGEKNRSFAGIILGIAPYLFLCFTIGLTGLSSPVGYLGVTLSIAMVTFILIHATAVKENHRGYFKRYIEPIPIFLPINLLTMWSPLLSLSLRMFGNAMSGFCIMSVLYYALENVSNSIFGGLFIGNYWANTLGEVVSGAEGPAGIFIAPLVTPILHLYFDLFSGFIQTMVFSMLTMIFVLQEQNEDPDQVIENVSVEVGGKLWLNCLED